MSRTPTWLNLPAQLAAVSHTALVLEPYALHTILEAITSHPT